MSLPTCSNRHFNEEKKNQRNSQRQFTFLNVNKNKTTRRSHCVSFNQMLVSLEKWEASEMRWQLTAWGRQFSWAGGHRLSTHLTETVPSIKGNSISWWKWTPGKLKRKMYSCKAYARNFPLFPMPWASCLPPAQSIFYRNSGQIVSAMWPWQSQALEEIQSMDASRAEVRLALYFHLKQIIKHILSE